MFYALSKIIDVLFSPLSWAILWAILGVVGRRQVTRWAAFAAAFILYVFSIEPVSNALLRYVEAQAPRTIRSNIEYDVVILLGGPVDHKPTQTSHVTNYGESAERLLTTFDLLRNERASSVIISGGRSGPEDEVVEARALSAQLQSWGIAPARIVLEDQARNTRENAVLSKRLVDDHHFKTVLVVTSAFHMPRALDCFRAVDLDVDALPVDYRSFGPDLPKSWLPRADSLASSTLVVRELIGRFIYRMAGYGKG